MILPSIPFEQGTLHASLEFVTRNSSSEWPLDDIISDVDLEFSLYADEEENGSSFLSPPCPNRASDRGTESTKIATAMIIALKIERLRNMIEVIVLWRLCGDRFRLMSKK